MKRHKRLARTPGYRMPRSPMKRANTSRKAKRRAGYRAILAAYRRSATRSLVTERSGGRCEFAVPTTPGVLDRGDRMEWQTKPAKWRRCSAPAGHHHHVRYPDVPGGERIEDMVDGCDECHALCEQIRYPHRNQNRRQSHTQRGKAAA
jgi:hypothetical protein